MHNDLNPTGDLNPTDDNVPAGRTPSRPTSANPQAITVTVQDSRGGTLVAKVAGEVDVLTAPVLRSNMDERLTDGRPFVLDLDGVSFLGSAGLSVLIEIRERADAAGIRWAIVASRTAVRRPLEITGLQQLLAVHATIADAVSTVTG